MLNQITKAHREFHPLPVEILKCLGLRDGLLCEGLGYLEVDLVAAEDVYHSCSTFLLILTIIVHQI